MPKKRTGRPPGRPELLTPEVHKRIIELIAGGNFPETAAAVVGVSRPTLRHWLLEGARAKRDAAGGKKCSPKERRWASFLTDVDAALGEAEARDVLLIAKQAQGGINGSGADWRASAWLLEHRNRDRWGRVEKVEMSGSLITADVTADEPSEAAGARLRRRLKEMCEAAAAAGSLGREET